MAGTCEDGMSGIQEFYVQVDERRGSSGAAESDSDSGCNLELTLGGSYGDCSVEMPILTLSSSVFASHGTGEDSGEYYVPPLPEIEVEGSFLSLGMLLPPPPKAEPEIKTIKQLQTMRRQEVKRSLMRKKRKRGRPPMPNQSLSRVFSPALSHTSPPSKTVPPSPRPSPQSRCPKPLSFGQPTPSCSMPPPATGSQSTSSAPASPMPLFLSQPPAGHSTQQYSSLALCPMPSSIIPPHSQSSSSPSPPSPTLSISFQFPSTLVSHTAPSTGLPPLPAPPHLPANCEGHKMATPGQPPESLPVEILRPLLVRWLLQHKYKRPKVSDRSDRDSGLERIQRMPTVVTTGAGPKGKRIEGFLYRFGRGQISLVCICHGMFFTPAEFVKHAGGDDVENPMKHIIVCSASSLSA